MSEQDQQCQDAAQTQLFYSYAIPLIYTNYVLKVPLFQLSLKWASRGSTEATALASCFHYP